jgi:SAM-dependent methyltransferase
MMGTEHAKVPYLKDCVGWDVVNWSKALDFWSSNLLLDNTNFLCLELGGNKGGLSLWLAEKGNTVICSDLDTPVDAKRMHQKYQSSKNISYQAIDATNIPYEDTFDIVVFKSILGGISRNGNTQLRYDTVNEIYKCLKPGGHLLFAENLTGSGLHTFFRKRMTSWGDSWNYLHMQELNGLFNKFKQVKYETAGFLGTFGRSESQRQWLGKIDTVLFDRVLSDSMKYIVYGVASK